jgi:hypothetical protein
VPITNWKSAADLPGMPKPDVSNMGYNSANFAYWIGEKPWVPGYSVYYAISFYDARTNLESERSDWWCPRSDPKELYGGFGLIRIPTDPTGQATGRRIWRKFAGQPEKLIYEIPDNVTTKYQDDVRQKKRIQTGAMPLIASNRLMITSASRRTDGPEPKLLYRRCAG